MTAIERLLAIEAIRELKARYFRGVDTRDAQLLRSVFAAGAETDFRSESPTADPALLLHDPDTFVRNTLEILEGMVTMHAGFMPEITFLSDSEAHGRWSMTDRLWTTDPSRTRLPFRSLEGWGVYHDRYRCGEQGWLITSTRLQRTRVILG